MADEIEFPKWIEEAFKRWVKSCETPVDSKQRWRELAQKSVDVLSNVDREKFADWKREWVNWRLNLNQKLVNGEVDETLINNCII